MYCIVCGTKNPDYGKYCYNCGSKLVRPLVEDAPSSSAMEVTPVEATKSEPINTPISINAFDLADVNPFLFKDDEEIPTSSQAIPASKFNEETASTYSYAASIPGSSNKPINTTEKTEASINPNTPDKNSQTVSTSSLVSTPPVQPNGAVSNPYIVAPTNANQPASTQNPYANQPANGTVNPYGGLSTPAQGFYNPNSYNNPDPPSSNQPPFTGQPQISPSNNYNPFMGSPQNISNQNFVPVPPRQPSIAPNGLPYDVVNRPKSYYNYKDKTGKRFYAAYADMLPRVLAVFIDTAIIFVPFLMIIIVYLATLGPDQFQQLTDASNRNDVAVVEQYLPHWVTLIFAAIYFTYTVLLTAGKQTLGKRIFKLRIITMTGDTPDLRTSLLRNSFGLAFLLGSYIAYFQNPFAGLLGQGLEILVGLGFTFALFDPRRQGWHDKLAGTLVIKSKQLVEGIDFPGKG